MKKLITVCTMVLAICCFGHTVKELEQTAFSDCKKIKFVIENSESYPRQLPEMLHTLWSLHTDANRKVLIFCFARMSAKLMAKHWYGDFIITENDLREVKWTKPTEDCKTCHGKLWHFVDVGQNGVFPVVCESCLDRMMKLAK